MADHHHHQTGDDLTIFYNDCIDSDNIAAALVLLKDVARRRPAGRLLWVLEPRQVALGLDMTGPEIKACNDLIKRHFPEHADKPFKALLGGVLNERDIDGIAALTAGDMQLLKKAVKVPYGPKEDARQHARLMAWDLASCLTQWSNEFYENSPAPKVEVLVDFDSLNEVQNPVNLNLHHHEELATRTELEIQSYNQIMKQQPLPQRVESLRTWYKECIDHAEKQNRDRNNSVGPLDVDSLCKTISASCKVRFMGGSSLRILRQFIDRNVAHKVECHLQVGSSDLGANLFANQFNIALNLPAAKYVLEQYEKFASFNVVPSSSAQSFKYSLVGLKRVGSNCLGKRMLGFNCHEDPSAIASGSVTLESKYPEKTAAMPDLTTFLCVLKEKEIGVERSFVVVDYTEPIYVEGVLVKEGVLLFKRADRGIPMYHLPDREEPVSADEVVKLLDFSGGGD